MALRAILYRKGLFKTTDLDIPVISVGNLTMGGTGKTPMTVYLAELLRNENPVVVCRGYRGTTTNKVTVVSNDEGLLRDVAEVGDEAYLLANRLQGIPVVVGSSKSLAAEYAVTHLKPGLIIVDDGFQHLALSRDLNVVLFKVDTFLGNNRVFPGGDMREPLMALKRADCFVLNCVDDENRERAEAIKKALNKKFPEIQVFMTSYQPVGIVNQQGESLEMSAIRNRRYFGFCGLAEPLSFKKTLEKSEVQLTGFRAFPDHHAYSAKDLLNLTDMAGATGAEGLITTAKDMVKVRSSQLALPVISVSIELLPFEGFAAFVMGKISS